MIRNGVRGSFTFLTHHYAKVVPTSKGAAMLRSVFAAAFCVVSSVSALAQDTLPVPELAGTNNQELRGASDEIISVALDFAALSRVPAGARTLVIGNPAIADASIQQTGVIVVTGKSYGTTNLVALDREGSKIAEILIHVTAPRGNTLTVVRGGARETWSCAPRCVQTVTLGDDIEFFKANSDQIGNRNTMATQQQQR